LRELIGNNSQALFGERTVMIDATATAIKSYVLLDFTEAGKPARILPTLIASRTSGGFLKSY